MKENMILENQTKRKKRKGFTLVELMIAVAIISILAAVAVPQYTKSITKAKASKAESLASTLTTASFMYAADNDGDLPTQLSDLTDYVTGDAATITTASGGALNGYTYTFNASTGAISVAGAGID